MALALLLQELEAWQVEALVLEVWVLVVLVQVQDLRVL
jgi:hypothetical protein